MHIGSLHIEPAFGVAPMAGMTDTAFRRLVKRQGGCGLVVSEMVSSEGLVRGIDRTLEYAEYTEEERPVSIQIFGGDPAKMADAAQIVEGMGADVVDINMGCPVPKISKHNAGCSLMREPAHAAQIVGAMAKAVRIPVTVKMRAGWNDEEINAPIARADGRGRRRGRGDRARPDGEAGVHGLVGLGAHRPRRAAASSIPVFGSGDCVEPEQIVERLDRTGVAGVLVGPRRAAQSLDSRAGGRPAAGRAGARDLAMRSAADSCSTTSICCSRERVDEADGFRHEAPMTPEERARVARRAGAGPRALGDQQAARADGVVQQGPRRRLAAAHGDQHGRVGRPGARSRRVLLRDRRDVLRHEHAPVDPATGQPRSGQQRLARWRCRDERSVRLQPTRTTAMRDRPQQQEIADALTASRTS